MNPFVCVIDLNGSPLGTEALATALPGLIGGRGRIDAVMHGPWAAAWVPSGELDRPAVAHRNNVVALGDVRLANRAELAARLEPAERLTDLELVIERYLAGGPASVRDLIGDFSFVIWDIDQQVAFAARDAFGKKSLFYQRRGDRLTIGSHIECLDQGDYDPDYVAHFLAGLNAPTTRTAFRSVTRLAAGTSLTVRRGRLETATWWSPAEFVPTLGPIDEEAAVRRFGVLFADAVAAQLDDAGPTWAFLSGGLDSSSNVSTAAKLAAAGRVRPLAGTLTVVDSFAEGDETRFSNAVLDRYPLRNEQIFDYWAWQPADLSVAARGEPHPFLPFTARDQELNRILRDGGATAVLSGFGSDHYLAGPPIYIADYVARGRLGEAARLLTDLAVSSRRSFWGLGFRNGIYPLLPRSLQRRWAEAETSAPEWIVPEAAARYGLADRVLRLDVPRTGGGRFADSVALEIGCLDTAFEPGACQRGIEIRYPFLHRPLVEFALSLPPAMRARPDGSKWVLREAMKDVLPEVVRARKGKGAIGARLLWSLNQEGEVLRRLIRDSHLAEMGFVDREKLAASFDRATAGDTRSVGLLLVTLALETWLAVRSGWWDRHGVRSQFNRLPSNARSQTRKDSVYEAAIR